MTDTQEEGSYLCFSSYPDYVSDNFRYKVYPDYKHNRKGKDKPKLYWDLRDYLLQNYDTKIKSTLEADDVLGIMSTLHPGEFIIVTSDKDLKQIPGEHFNPDTMELFDVTPEQGDYWFYKQILTGDATDGYPGCKGIGPKKADTILESTFREYRENGNIPKWFIWKYGIKPTYESKGLTEDFALSQARVARILRAEDYDFKKKQVKLWTP
jgi:DNA polymerase-1